MLTFTDDWAQEIADVSGLPEYQRATIQILGPATVTGTVATNWEATLGTPLYTGQARIVVVSGGTNTGGGSSSDPTNIVTIRIQIPYSKTFSRVERGQRVRVTDGGRNDRLKSYLFTVNSDVNSSNVASLTFVATTNVESDPNYDA